MVTKKNKVQKIKFIDNSYNLQSNRNPNIDRQIIGLRPTGNRGKNDKDLNWPEAKKRYPKLNRFGDLDHDGSINSADCTPLDPSRQNWFTDQAQKAIDAAKAATAAAAAKAKAVADAAAKAAAETAARLKAAAEAKAKAVADAAAKALADAKAKAIADAKAVADLLARNKAAADAAARAKADAEAKAAAEAQARATAKAAADAAAAKAALDKAAADAAAKKVSIASPAPTSTPSQPTLLQKVENVAGQLVGMQLGVVSSVLPKQPTPAPVDTTPVVTVAPTPAPVTFTSGLTSGVKAAETVQPIQRTADIITKVPDTVTSIVADPFRASQKLSDYENKMIVSPVTKSDAGTVSYVPAITTAPQSVKMQSELKTDILLNQAKETAVLETKVADLTSDAQKQLDATAAAISNKIQGAVDSGSISSTVAQKQFDMELANAQKAIETKLNTQVAMETKAAETAIKQYATEKQAEVVPKIETQMKIEQKSEVIPNLISGAIRGATYAIPYAGNVVLAADITKTAIAIPEEISFLKAGGTEALKSEAISLGTQAIGMGVGGLAASSAIKTLKSDISSESLTSGMKTDFTQVKGFESNVKTLSSEPSTTVNLFKKVEKAPEVKSTTTDYGLLGKSDIKPIYDVSNIPKAPVQEVSSAIFKESTKPVPTPPEPVFQVVTKQGIPEIQAASLSSFTKAAESAAIKSATEKALSKEAKPIEFSIPAKDFAEQMQINRLKSGADVVAVDLTKGTVGFKPAENAFTNPKPEVLASFDTVKQPPKPEISEIQLLALENFKKSQQKEQVVEKPIQAAKPMFTFEVAKPEKKITFMKFKDEIPQGYTAKDTGQGLLTLVKEELKTVQKPKEVVFQILNAKQIAELEARRIKAYDELTKTKTKVVEDVITKTKQDTFALPSTVTLTIPRLTGKQATTTELGFKQGSKVDLAFKEGQLKATKTSFATKTIPKQESRTAFSPRLDTRTILSERAVLQNLKVTPATLQLPKVLFRLRDKDSVFKSKEPTRKSAEQGYDVYIKRRGKLQGLGVSLTKSQAGLLAQKKLKESLAATAFIRASGKKAVRSNIAIAGRAGEFRQYRVVKGQKIYDPTLFIQRAKFRLGTRAEKTEIQSAAARAAAQSNKRRTGGFFGF